MTAVDGTSTRVRAASAIHYALQDLPAMAVHELRDLSPAQLVSIAKAASMVKMFAEDALGALKQQ